MNNVYKSEDFLDQRFFIYEKQQHLTIIQRNGAE